MPPLKCADQLALSYYRSFNLPVKLIRPFNTYGPRQSNRAIIPTIISQCIKNKKKRILLGNINPTRDLNYVEDVCDAFYEIFKSKKAIGQVLNVGTNSNISIYKLAKKIMKIMKVNYKIKNLNLRKRPKKSEVENLKCNNSKIKKFTNWKSKTKLDSELKKTIKWYLNNLDKITFNQYL